MVAAGSTSSGAPEAYNHYAVGWAHAMDTPYQWTKQIASHWGGTRNGTIVHWPAGIEAKGEVRNQFHHVIDVAPTVLEVAGLPDPTFVNGVQQAAAARVSSMAYSFDDAVRGRPTRPPSTSRCVGNRGIYHNGLDRRSLEHCNPVADPTPATPAARRRRLGAVRARRLDSGPRRWRRESRTSWPTSSGLFLLEAGKLQRASRSTTGGVERFNAGPRRPPDS